MTDEEIDKVTEALRAEASKSSIGVKFVPVSAESNAHRVVGTRGGFLRMARFFMLAAIEPQIRDSLEVGVILDDNLCAPSSDVIIESFERNENLKKVEYVPRERTFKEKIRNTLGFVGCGLFLFCIGALILIGFVTVLHSIFR